MGNERLSRNPFRLFCSRRLTFEAQDADRHDDHRDALQLQAARDGVGSLVVEERVVPLLRLEEQLAGEENGAGKLLRGSRGKVDRFCHRVGAEREFAARREAKRARQQDELVDGRLPVGAQPRRLPRRP